MGYRSAVRLIVENFDKVDVEYDPESLREIFEDWKDFIEIKNNRFTLNAESVKWYEGYPEVKNIYNLWDWLQEHKIPAAFGVIGEDLGDTTINYTTLESFSLLEISRSFIEEQDVDNKIVHSDGQNT